MSKSLMSDERECYLCGSPYVELHHVFFGTGRRAISDREGCTVYLCHAHHQNPRFGVHFDKELDLKIKRECQKRWMEKNGKTIEEFRETFHGMSYL